MEQDLFNIPIEHFKSYRITKDGKIWSDKSNKFLKQRLVNGYYHTSMENKKPAIHRLVALTFIPKIKDKPYVNHINEDKLDNRVENLEWCNQKENCNAHSKKISHAREVIKMDLDGNELEKFEPSPYSDIKGLNLTIKLI